MQTIKVFVGLGNPGDDYANTRHNAGFWFVDKIAQRFNANWALHKKFQGMISEVIIGSNKFFIFKPMQYMNRSGLCVGSLAKFYNITPEQICVIHDELDLPAGDIRLKFKGGSGGHNGLKDITSHLNSLDYYRLRIGISHPGSSHLVHNYVLKNPSISDKKNIDDSIDRGISELENLLLGDFSGVMKRLNTLKANKLANKLTNKSGDNNGV